MAEPTFEDRVMIRELYSRFYWALNATDAQGMIDCFAPGGHIVRYKGDTIQPAESAEIATAMRHATPDGETQQHHVTNVIVHPDEEGREDHAYVEMYFMVTDVKDPPAIRTRWSCSARDDLQKVDGKWLYAKRRISLNHDDTGDY